MTERSRPMMSGKLHYAWTKDDRAKGAYVAIRVLRRGGCADAARAEVQRYMGMEPKVARQCVRAALEKHREKPDYAHI